PTFACPSDTAVAACSYTLTDYTSTLIVTDNCSNSADVTITQSPATGTVVNLGDTLTVWLYATDVSGNIDSCSFHIAVIDTISPTITCLGAITLSSNADCEITVPDLTAHFSAVEDNCTDENDLVITQSIPAGTQVTGTTVVWVYVRDAYDNVDSCSVQLILEDNIPPVLNGPFPTDTTINCDALIPVPIVM